MGGGETITEASEKAANGTTSPEESVRDMATMKEEGEAAKENKKYEVDQMNEDQGIKEAESKNKKQNGEEEKEKEDAKSETTEEDPLAKEESSTLVEKNEDEVKEEDELKVEESMVEESAEKEPKKPGKGNSSSEKGKVKDKKEPEQRTPATDRPMRERKSVERLVASVEKDTVKELKIEKGRGTPLKDIPNVAFKLSRRKTDDTFKLLHTVLFGRRGKAFQIKSNISRFSGFVWQENEEKQKSKVKEKFDKCNKEKLLEFCDVLDIPFAKSSTRKEDIVTKLIDFLIAPHATTTGLLAEKEKSSKGTKRKRAAKGGSSSSGSALSAKSRKRSGSSQKERSAPESEGESEGEEAEDEAKEEENENGIEENSGETAEDAEGGDGTESEDESDDHAGKSKNKKTSKKKDSASKVKTKKAVVSKDTPSKKTPIKSSLKQSKDDDDNDKSPKVSSRKKGNAEVVKGKKSSTPAKSKPSAPAKSGSKEKAVKSSGKGNSKTKVKTSKPTDTELRDAIVELLKEVDINKATFTDILNQLGERFNADMMPRKQSIKVMIQEELARIAEDDEEDDDDGDDGSDDGRVEETKATGEGVKA